MAEYSSGYYESLGRIQNTQGFPKLFKNEIFFFPTSSLHTQFLHTYFFSAYYMFLNTVDTTVIKTY